MEIHHHYHCQQTGEHSHPPQIDVILAGLDHLVRHLFHITEQGFTQMTVNTDALIAKIGPLGDAVQGLVSIVAGEPGRTGEAVRKALADRDLLDAQAQTQVDEATQAAQTDTDQLLAAAAQNTGTTLPPPVVADPGTGTTGQDENGNPV